MKDLVLQLVWHLVHEAHAALSLYGCNSVILPVEVKVVFDVIHQLLFQGVSIVEPAEQRDPLTEVLVVANLPQTLVVGHDVDELSDNKREDRHSE